VVRIFLSHSSRDAAIVEPIRAQASAIDVDVYLHELHPQPGEVLSNKIKDAIGASDALVVLITANAAVSPYVNQEIGFALGQALPVIPLVAPGVTMDQLAMLQGVEFVAFDPDHPHEALTQLTATLHAIQVARLAQVTAAKQAEMDAALRRQQQLSVALGFVCVLLILYIVASSAEGPDAS
jgi:hypothetical protein